MTTMITELSRHTAPSQKPRSGAPISLDYFGSVVRHMLSDPSFIGFLLVMPTAFYLFFGQIYGADPEWGMDAKKQILLQMATYGAMGSALSAGNAIQMERSTGWFRQLMITGLSPASFFLVRAAAALLMIVPPIALVLLVGRLDGVEFPFWTWFKIIGVALIVLIPFVIMGLVIGLWFRAQAANAATTFIMMAMAMIGGMWVPLEMMPEFLQGIGRVLPSYWAVQFAALPVTGDPIPMRGVVVILIWTVALTVLGVLGYRRALKTSKR